MSRSFHVSGCKLGHALCSPLRVSRDRIFEMVICYLIEKLWYSSCGWQVNYSKFTGLRDLFSRATHLLHPLFANLSQPPPCCHSVNYSLIMFSNPIKRLSESLAQAQEQARQQRLRYQQSPGETKSQTDAETEASSSVNGEEEKQIPLLEDRVTVKPSEDPAPMSVADIKDTTLPKEVRIKLAKLAKYEDRHPSKPALWTDTDNYKNCRQHTRKARVKLLRLKGFCENAHHSLVSLRSMISRITSKLSQCEQMYVAIDFWF